ncbi:unnamed protein product [Bubo scandiacus]
MSARSGAGRRLFAFFQWKKLVTLLCVGPCLQSLYYSVMNSHESHIEKHLGACQRQFVWRKPFLGRFESHWKPFLTSRSLHSLMDRLFRRVLEKVLRFHKLPFGLQNSVLSAFTTLQLLPQQELPGSFAGMRLGWRWVLGEQVLWCQRCIVVGNGYSIHGQHFGKMIDSHHFIIRLNDAAVKEHKKDMGERTRICLFFPESALPNPLENNGNDTLMVFVPFKPLGFLWLREVLLKTRNKMKVGFWHQPPPGVERECLPATNSQPYVTYEAMYKLLQLDVSSRRYGTTGISALNLALHMCQEVNIAGFGYPGNRDNTMPIYYYNMGHSQKKEGVIADIASPSFQAQNC